MHRTSFVVQLTFLIAQLTQSGRGTTTDPSVLISTYSNSLSMTSPTFLRPNGVPGYSYYYQAIQVTPATSAQYSLSSSSSTDTYGCLYQHWFDPSNPTQNLISCGDDSGYTQNFLISSYLQTSASYILVVTTYTHATTGAYSVFVRGPATVNMASIDPTITTTTTTPRPFTTPGVTTTYSGRLSSSSPTFSRSGTGSNNFYYQAIQTITYTSGSYTLRSYSSMDTYGCLYSGSFNPSSPDQNKVACDDDSGTSGQFLINSSLEDGATYLLVVTTFSSRVTGGYSISVTGPGPVSMTSMRPVDSSSSSLTSGQIVAISIGSILLLLLIAILSPACKRQRRASSNRPVNSSRSVQTVPQVNLVRMPYTITKPPDYSVAIEEAPPSYEAYISSTRT